MSLARSSRAQKDGTDLRARVPAVQENSLKSARAILVVRMDEIGDLVMTGPFLRELRRNAPQAFITLVVKPQFLNLVELCPYVDEVLTFEWQATGRAQKFKRTARSLLLAATGFWKRRFDLAIIPRWGPDLYHAVRLAYYSGARRRVGYSEEVIDRKGKSNLGYDRLLTDSMTDGSVKHQVEHNLDVIRYLGGEVVCDRLEAWLDERDWSYAARVFAEHSIAPADSVVAFAPGAGYKTKQWPIERFSELGRLFLGEDHPYLVVVGGSDAISLGERLQTELGPHIINLAGRATLRQTAAVLERCRLTVSNDSGPMHLAAAAGCAVIEISWHFRDSSPGHPDSPARFHPWGVRHVVVQPQHAMVPCRDSCESFEAHCILGVETGQVWDAARGLAIAEVGMGSASNTNAAAV